MGILVDSIKALVPSRGQAVTATIPVGTSGTEQYPAYSYDRFAREGYGRNELVYACIEALATSAAEPRLCAYTADGEKIDNHPLIKVWNKPNPWLDRFTIGASIVMYLSIAGNAYIEKVRSGAGKIVELWLPRPDRVFVVPDRDRYVAGYDYVIGAQTYRWAETDIVHVKNRNPLTDGDFYGLPPLAVLAERVDLDNFARQFTSSYFRNAGVPAGLLTIQQKILTEQERTRIMDRFRALFSGRDGWHRLAILDGGQATYTPMAQSLGQSGAGLADLDLVNEARICMPFGVPPSIVATRLGQNTGSYANRVQDQAVFWDQTLAPLYKQIAEQLTLGFQEDYGDFAYLAFDMADVKALAEDADKLSARVMAQLAGGLITQEEARVALGYPETPDQKGTYYVPSSLIPTPSDQLVAPPMPEPTPADQAAADGSSAYAEVTGAPAPSGNGRH